MTHRRALLLDLDERIARLLSRQITAEGDERFGGFWTEDFHVESRESGFFLGDMVAAFVTEDSRWYLNAGLKAAIQRDLVYMQRHQRPGGCFDLTPCNYASPPDTAFMVNAMLNGWWLLENAGRRRRTSSASPCTPSSTARPGASRRAASTRPTTAGPFPPAC